MSGPEISKLKQRLDEALFGPTIKKDYENISSDQVPQWFTDKVNEVTNKISSLGFTIKSKDNPVYMDHSITTIPVWWERIFSGKRSTKQLVTVNQNASQLITQRLAFTFPKYKNYRILLFVLGVPSKKKCRIIWRIEEIPHHEQDAYHTKAQSKMGSIGGGYVTRDEAFIDDETFEQDLSDLITNLEHFKNGQIVSKIDAKESRIKDWWGFNPTNSLKENSDWVSQIGNIFKLKVSGSNISNEDAYINIIDLDPEFAKDYWKEIDQIANVNRFQLFDVEPLQDVYGEESEEGSQLQFERF